MPQSIWTDEERWSAVQSRSETADGAFVYAVLSTRIYCRPICPSRRPRRENVRYFPNPPAAEAAGFRPCLRCRPNRSGDTGDLVGTVRALLDQEGPILSLADLAAAVGLSRFHVQRLFRRATGVTPRQYAAALRAERLRSELKRGASVTAALYDSGYGSSRALCEHADTTLGMSPGAYRHGGRGQRIRYGLFETELGHCLAAATDRGVCALRFGAPAALEQELAEEFPQAERVQESAAVAGYMEMVRAYLEGSQRELTLPLDLSPTEFQRRVWAALQSIPAGQTRSYQEVAAMVGAPKAARAVGRACATNPVALAIPCHRVVRSDGDLSGYRWGLNWKRRLLEQEHARARDR